MHNHALCCVNGDWPCQRDMTPSQNPHPLTDHQKIVVTDGYLVGPNARAKYGANPSMGLLGKWVKYNAI